MKKIENKDKQPFSKAFSKAKQDSRITEAELCAKSKISSSHFYYILSGNTQPSIDLAIVLVSCLGVDISSFFKDLAVSEKLLSLSSSANEHSQASAFGKSFIKTEDTKQHRHFGTIFKDFRVCYNVTQKELSEAVEYSIRSIQKVEAGTQDPNVMTALKMVCAVAQKANIDIDVFFHAYQKIIKEISE